MKAIIVFSGFFFAVLAIPTKTLREDSPKVKQLIDETALGVSGIQYLTGPIPHYEAKEEDVKFYFASRENVDHIEVNIRDPNSISKTSFSPDKDTWFIVHGWLDDNNSDIMRSIGNALIEKADVNIFCVDWGCIAKENYPQAFAAVPEIGKIIGDLMRVLLTDHGLHLEKVFLVGHSLGAHVAGRVGASLDGKIPLIVGLDPAGPLFLYEMTSNRLDSSNAQFVHVIHTNSGFLGFWRPLGHADYYPNGGVVQPACPFDLSHPCSHLLSYTYFAESIVSGNFVAKSCPSEKDFTHGKCNDNASSEMGGYWPDRRASGTYYLETSKKPPYAKG